MQSTRSSLLSRSTGFAGPLRLSDLPIGVQAWVRAVDHGPDATPDNVAHTMARRLGELGFIAGEPVQLLRYGPGGREPLAVQVGESFFALRRVEAQCVVVQSHEHEHEHEHCPVAPAVPIER